MLTLTSDNFIESIFTTNHSQLILVQFTASWCSSCHELQNVLNELILLYPNIILYKVDVDESSDLADQYNVNKLPTILFFKNRRMVDFIIGAEPVSNFNQIIKNNIN